MNVTLVLHNGIIHTLARPARASAIAVAGDQIVAIGDDTGVCSLVGSGTTTIDLRGRCVIPGIIDAHIHLGEFGLSLDMVDLDGARSLDECLDRVARFARQTKAAWIQGWGWNDNAWDPPTFPDRHVLDKVVPDRPVALTRKDGHSIWVNSPALKAAGIGRETPDPPGGSIERNPASGEPIGILRENAQGLVRRVLPRPGPAEMERALLLAQGRALANGVTGVHTMEGPEVFAALQRLDAQGKLALRVCMSIPGPNLDHAVALGLRSGFGHERVRVGGLKLFADGSLGSVTAAMIADYEGLPGNRGIMTLPKDELRVLVRRALAAGISPVVHAIGDRANRDVLDVFEECAAEGLLSVQAQGSGRQPLPGRALAMPPRIEHVQVLQEADIPRFARLGVVASMQPIHCTSDRDAAVRLWGARCRYAYAWRSLLQSGAVLAFGSDCPVETMNPLAGIHAAATRQRIDEPDVPSWYPQECLTAEEALRAYTLGSAYASGEEIIKGSLAPGALADMVVLSQDILGVPLSQIPATQVDMTIIGGRVVYTRPDAAGGPTSDQG